MSRFSLPIPDDYGAKGDGSTDDVLAFQRALDACKFGPLLIPPGRIYAIGAPGLNMDKGPVRMMQYVSGNPDTNHGLQGGLRPLAGSHTLLRLTSNAKLDCLCVLPPRSDALFGGTAISTVGAELVKATDIYISVANGAVGWDEEGNANDLGGWIDVGKDATGIVVGRYTTGAGTVDTMLGLRGGLTISATADAFACLVVYDAGGLMIGQGFQANRGRYGAIFRPDENQAITWPNIVGARLGDQTEECSWLIDTGHATGMVVGVASSVAWASGKKDGVRVLNSSGGTVDKIQLDVQVDGGAGIGLFVGAGVTRYRYSGQIFDCGMNVDVSNAELAL